jgi:hypothetical protein
LSIKRGDRARIKTKNCCNQKEIKIRSKAGIVGFSFFFFLNIFYRIESYKW